MSKVENVLHTVPETQAVEPILSTQNKQPDSQSYPTPEIKVRYKVEYLPLEPEYEAVIAEIKALKESGMLLHKPNFSKIG